MNLEGPIAACVGEIGGVGPLLALFEGVGIH